LSALPATPRVYPTRCKIEGRFLADAPSPKGR